MILFFIMLCIVGLSLLVIHARQMSTVVLALASISALTSVVLFQLSAHTAAVIELSVGAGLVAVLFAFTNSLTNGEKEPQRALVAWTVAALLASAAFALLVVFLSSALPEHPVVHTSESFGAMFWEQRSPDIFVQLALIFTGALGVLSLLADVANAPEAEPASTKEVQWTQQR